MKNEVEKGRVVATVTAKSKQEAIAALELLLDVVKRSVFENGDDTSVNEKILVTVEGKVL